MSKRHTKQHQKWLSFVCYAIGHDWFRTTDVRERGGLPFDCHRCGAYKLHF